MTTTTLFTLNELKSTLSIATSDSSYDLELSLLVTHVPQLFESYIGIGLGVYQRNELRYANKQSDQIFFLDAYPLININSIAVNGSTTSSYSIINKNLAEIQFDTDSLNEGDEIAINYLGGFADLDSIKYPALVQAKYMFMRHQHQQIHLDQEGKIQSRMIYKNDQILPIVKVFLDPISRNI